MSISEETIMAFADGELSDTDRAAVEQAMRENPEIAKQVARHVALRQRLSGAYAAELSEPVTERLLMAARRAVPSRTGTVASLKDARDARDARGTQVHEPTASRWRPLGSIAASVIVGFGLGYAVLRHDAGPVVQTAGGAMIANGELSRALSSRLAGDHTAPVSVHIGISFLAKSGDYCRTFTLPRSVSEGIACHHAQEWRIESLSRTAQVGATAGEYHTAGTAMSPATLRAVEDQIVGEPLDNSAEAIARDKGWAVR